MVKIRKCQSKKHGFGGCGDPRCPEGLSIQAALEEAVQKHDLNSFLAARDLGNASPAYLSIRQGMASLLLAKGKKTVDFKFVANRPEVTAYIKSIDKTDLKSFDNVYAMQSYLNELYGPYGHISLRDYTEEQDTFRKPSGFDLKRLSVANMDVDADVRGLGVGRHMRATVLKFADEHNYVVTGTPSESGDGTIEQNEDNYEEYKAHCIAHKARLEKFYLDSGYEYNFAVTHYGNDDYWTGEPYPENPEWEKKLHPAAVSFIRESGSYIRWPNGEVPENWKAGATSVGKATL